MSSSFWHFLSFSLVLISLSTSVVSLSLLLPGSPVSDTANQPCVKPVNETLLPKCRITFREEGSFGTLNGTCVEDNVFVISPNRTRPRVSQTKDYLYFTSIFDDDLPPYVRITCTSMFPTDFDFEGPGTLDFFRVWKGQRRTPQNTTYTINAEVLLTPEATGKYIFRSILNPEAKTTFFIFSERGSKPFMVGGTSRRIPAVKLNDTATLIPCIASDLNANVTLFKQTSDNMIWSRVSSAERSSYNRQTGFILNPPAVGLYRCFGDAHEYISTDYVTIEVKSPSQNGTVKPKSIKLEIQNGMAVCYSILNRTDIKFSNAYARNPTENRLLETCLQRKGQYCGSHSYHQRKEGQKVLNQNVTCPNNSPSCLWITDVHQEGIFYCETGDEGDSITQEYFTGLDKKIYTSITDAPTSVLIRAEWRPNTTALKTATLYEFSCEAVGLLFLKDPFTLSVKYKNGTVDKLTDLVWWQGSRSFYLTTDMEEIICSDNLWKTNELINSGTKITVTEKQCESEQFKCKSGQCIREAWRCDGDKDCADGSDEESCLHHSCKVGHFKCTNGLCIMGDKKCNNKNECVDGSDESLELCANTTCSSDDFKCASGQCAPAHFLCDGDKDCFDQSDEDAKHCSKYHPQFTSANTHVMFTPNSLNELICKVSLLPIRLKPTIAWWRRGENISDPERLWQDNTGLKLSLRFENITQDDNGEYTCVATNKLQRVVQVFTVTVQGFQSDLSCRSDLSTSECVNRGCAYIEGVCMTEEDAAKLTISTTIPTTTISSNAKTSTESLHYQESSISAEDSEAGAGVTIGICLLLIAVVGLVLSGLGWRYYTRRHVPAGSARMRDDQEVVLSGI